jgi:hypothetical protein
VQCDDSPHHVLRADVALADRRIQRRHVHQVEVLGNGLQRVVAEQPLQRLPLLAQQPGYRLLALLDRLFTALLGEPLADLGARRGLFDEVQPVPARPGARRLGGEDLDHVAVVELTLQWHQPSVDPGADAAMSDLGVHRVGEVDGVDPAGRERTSPAG